MAIQQLYPRGTSVLDDDRLSRALARLTAKERRAAVAGLTLLARGCSAMQQAEHRPTGRQKP